MYHKCSVRSTVFANVRKIKAFWHAEVVLNGKRSIFFSIHVLHLDVYLRAIESSFALGYPRTTENVTIDNCYVTGNYEVGTVFDGSWRKMAPGVVSQILPASRCDTMCASARRRWTRRWGWPTR